MHWIPFYKRQKFSSLSNKSPTSLTRTHFSLSHYPSTPTQTLLHLQNHTNSPLKPPFRINRNNLRFTHHIKKNPPPLKTAPSPSKPSASQTPTAEIATARETLFILPPPKPLKISPPRNPHFNRSPILTQNPQPHHIRHKSFTIIHVVPVLILTCLLLGVIGLCLIFCLTG